MRTDIGQQLANARIERHVLLGALAVRFGVRASLLSEIEWGRATPDAALAQKIQNWLTPPASASPDASAALADGSGSD